VEREPVRYRRCRRADLLPAGRMIMLTFNALRRQTGKDVIRRRIRSAPPMFVHALERDPKYFYCAWHRGRVVGFAGAVNRGRQWYLAWLFVHPRYQGRGVGRRLLELVWRDGPGVTHGLCTFSYNVQAVSIYGRFGMNPRGIIHMMRAPAERLSLPSPTGLTVQDGLRRGDLAWIHALETEIRGYPRPPEWDYWSRSEDYRIHVFHRRSRRVGYGVVNTIGEIAPAGARTPREFRDVMAEMMRSSAERRFGRNVKNPSVQLFCPTANAGLYKELLRAGLRNVEVLLFLADADYGDFSRYLPATLAFF
jgi:ribosomal protein S18 acetylase RimI-like enzyme